MKVAEILMLCSNLMKTLHHSGVKMSDYQYTELYKDYLNMKRNGEKTTFIAVLLAQRYGVSERFVYKLVKRLEKDCPIGSVGV